jgi:hypothetical protein
MVKLPRPFGIGYYHNKVIENNKHFFLRHRTIEQQNMHCNFLICFSARHLTAVLSTKQNKNKKKCFP